MKIKARFKGMDGSLGLLRGKIYDIEAVPSKTHPITLHIYIPNGKIVCPYGSLSALIANWQFDTR
jgi:hypothetical protein